MKILQTLLIIVLTVALLMGAGYLYASSGIQAKPGYVKLDLPSLREAVPIISVKLGPRGLKPARWVMEQVIENAHGNTQIAEQVLRGIVNDVHGVQLAVYEVGQNRATFDDAIDTSVARLKREGWQTLVKVRERDEHVVIMQAGDDTVIEGLSLLVSNTDNAVFINVIGPFDPNSIAKIATAL
jgi:hypothetical protein